MGMSPAINPANDFSGILTATGFTAYIEKCRRHQMAQRDALLEAAAVLRRGIEKTGKWYLGGLDAKWAARKITRPIRHAAYLHEEAAKALSSSHAVYLGTFGSAAKMKKDAASFDPTR